LREGKRKRERERVINKTLKISGTMGRCRKSLRKVNDFKYMKKKGHIEFRYERERESDRYKSLF